MGIDLLSRDASLAEGLQMYAKTHHGELDEDNAAALEEYMSQRSQQGSVQHDIEALQKHLTDAKILTEPHAPIHDMLRHAGLVQDIGLQNDKEYVYEPAEVILAREQEK